MLTKARQADESMLRISLAVIPNKSKPTFIYATMFSQRPAAAEPTQLCQRIELINVSRKEEIASAD